MNLKSLLDTELDHTLVKFAAQERELLTKVLHHLREVERRRLYASLKFKSLFDYAVRRLGYSEDQAARRIAAMRLLHELPEIEQKIENGSLNLTSLGMAQTLFRQEHKRASGGLTQERAEAMPKQAKLALLQKLEHKSTREAEKIVIAASSAPTELRPDRIRRLAENTVEIRFVGDESLLKKIDTLKGLLAHSHAQCTTGELFEKICDMAIAKLSPGERKSRDYDAAVPAAPQKQRSTDARSIQETNLTSAAPAFPPTDKRPHIPARIQKEVWQRAGCKCQNCGSQRALQIDHIIPFASGGGCDFSNLRLLCRSCNQRAAILHFGINKMSSFVREPACAYQ